MIVLRNDVPLPRNPANLFYDGHDKVSSVKVVTMARSVWYANSNPGTMLADTSEVYDVSRWGVDYRLPIGEDLNSMSTYMFEYVTLLVMASQNGTTVNIDKNGDGTVDVTTTLNQGDAYQLSSATVGDLTSNAQVTSTKPVQVDLMTGDIGSNYEQRWFTLLPTNQAGSSYYAPVGTVASSYPAAVFAYNPSQTTGITVNYQTQAGSGSFAVSAKGVYRFAMPTLSGAHFWTANSAPFMAVGANDTTTNSGANTQNQTYDWGYTLVPETNLTTRLAVGRAPGTGDLPPAANGSPVWVMAIKPTTIYADYDGNPATGPNTAPNGGKYDISYNVAALASQRIYDPDKDQTGMRVFTTDGTLITGAWGEDGSTAQAGNPFLDVGYTVPPLPEIVVVKSMTLVTDVNGNGLVNPGDTIEYKISITNRSVVKVLGIIVQDTVPTNSTYVANSTKVGSTIIPDDTSGTPIPIDGAGYNVGDIDLGATVEVTFRVTANLTGTYDQIINTATVRDGDDTYIVNITTPISPREKTSCSLNLTNSAWSTVSIYLENGTVYIQVTDNDRNINTGAADTITALAQTAATGDRENVSLTETGINTGVFRGSIPSSTTGGQTVYDGTLYARGGDQISASFTDPDNGDSCNATATITVQSQTKILYLSDPSQAMDRVDPVATGDGTTATSPTLSTDSGSIAFAATTSTDATNTGSVTFSHTSGTGSNRLLLVGVSFQKNNSSTRQVNTVTFSGQSLTRAGFAQSPGDLEERAEIWYLVNPPSGPANVVVTMTGTPESIVAGAHDVHGRQPDNTSGICRRRRGRRRHRRRKSERCRLVSAGQLVFDVVSIDQGATASVGGGQTARWNQNSGTGTEDTRGAASTEPGAASVTMSWTSGDTDQAWAQVAVPIRPAPAGVPTTTFTQAPAMASNFVMPAGGTVGVTTYVNVTSGSMPANPNITAVLKYGATTFATLTNPTYSSGAGTLTWSGALTATSTCRRDRPSSWSSPPLSRA